MRIKRIELSWFRGAAENGSLDTDLKSVVVYGSNGSGKSTFVDSLEYLINKGLIAHLAHEYSGSNQEKGVRNTQAPADKLSKCSVTFEDNSFISAEIQPSGASEISSNPTDLKTAIQSWDVKNHILRQDEVARFIHCSKGEKYSTLLPLLGLSELEYAAENLRQIKLRVSAVSGIESNKGRIQQLILEASGHLTSLDESEVQNKLNEIARKYGIEKPANEISSLSGQLTTKINSLLNSLEPLQTRHVITKQIVNENIAQKLGDMTSADNQAETQVDASIDNRISVLDSTEKYVSLITDHSVVIECPACGQKVLGSQLAEHVTKELEKLKELRKVTNVAKEKRRALAVSLQNVIEHCANQAFRSWVMSPGQEDLLATIEELTKLDIPANGSKWKTETLARALILFPKFQSTLEMEAKNMPSPINELVNDRDLVNLCAKMPLLYDLQKDVNRVAVLMKGLEESEGLVRREIRNKTRQILATISDRVKLLWSELHPNEPIGNVSLCTHGEQDKTIDVSLNFFGTEQQSPRLTLSEGYRNSLGLCIFLALTKLNPDGGPIFLDDIVSSLDREHRGMLADLILKNFNDRQIILFTHDREWYTELRYRMPSTQWKFLALRPWDSPVIGLRWSSSADTFDDARALLDLDAEACGNRTRAIMDMHLAIAAEKLEVQLPYLRGDKNDHRTGVDFLKRIIRDAPNRLKKKEGDVWVPYATPIIDWQNAENLLVAWGDRASHTGSLTKVEAERLIEACQKALAHFRCDLCGTHIWTARQSSNDRSQCTCGSLQWRER
jgi:energy-coupling factor transporter ATP-binding protein EcfA2